jgi:hypothetical protein
MKRRTTDPLALLLPVASLAAVGLVAACGSLAAVQAATTHASTQPAPATSATKLVAIPHYAQRAKRTTSSSTITNQAEINRVAEIINTLPTAPTGIFDCPDEIGGGLELEFESADGTVVERASMAATGCGGTSITIGSAQSERASGQDTIQQIQDIIGTHWQLIPSLTS